MNIRMPGEVLVVCLFTDQIPASIMLLVGLIYLCISSTKRLIKHKCLQNSVNRALLMSGS